MPRYFVDSAALKSLSSPLTLTRNQVQDILTVISALPVPPIPEFIKDKFWDCANKSTAVYCATSRHPPWGLTSLLTLAYDIWRYTDYPATESLTFLTKTILYGRPFESHFKSRFKSPQSLPFDCGVATVDGIVQTHLDLCNKFDVLHKETTVTIIQKFAHTGHGLIVYYRYFVLCS